MRTAGIAAILRGESMKALLFALLMLQVGQAPKGFVTGLVHTAAGAPAPGIRVYAIPAGDPNAVTAGPTVFEGLGETDAAGRYRLEVPAGRYYVAVGSLTTPTYFPDTTSIAAAKPILIAADATIESIDFGKYVAAPATFGLLGGGFGPPPGSTGVLSGVVRFANGTAASGLPVLAVPVSILNATITGPPQQQFIAVGQQVSVLSYSQPGTTQRLIRGGGLAITNSQGRFRMEDMTPDTYKIIAGYSDFPVFYPDTTDVQKATALTTTASTNLTALDITLPAAFSPFFIRGRITALAGSTPGGVTMDLQYKGFSSPTGIGLLLPDRTFHPAISGADGSFEIADAVSGRYVLRAQLSGAVPQARIIEVGDGDAREDFDFTDHVFSGRIVWEDGTPFSDPGLTEIGAATISNPSVVSTVLSSASRGAFSSVINPGDYQFYVRSLSDEFVVRSITAGATDLTNNPLRVDDKNPINILVRVAKSAGGKTIRGRVLDALTHTKPEAESIELCCLRSGPADRMSATLQPDGAFEFAGVPPGRYAFQLKSSGDRGTSEILNGNIEVAAQEVAALSLVSSSRSEVVTATVQIEDGSILPASSSIAIRLAALPGDGLSIPMTRLSDGSYSARFPTGIPIEPSLMNIPAGYRVKLISSVPITIILERP